MGQSRRLRDSIAAMFFAWVATVPCLGQSLPTSPPPVSGGVVAPAAKPQTAKAPARSDALVHRTGQIQAVPLPSPSMPTDSRMPPAPVPDIGSSNAPSTAALDPGSGELGLKLKAAPLDTTDVRFPIDLATALRLSDARPLIVAAAQAGVWVAEAQLKRAKVLWVPQLNLGFDYVRHDGGGPDFNKGIMTAPSVNFFYGGGGAIWNVATTDIIFQPLYARQTLTARQAEIQAAKNDVLMETANAYFGVHQARGKYAGSLYTIERGYDLVKRISLLSADLVSKVEVDRAKNMVANIEQRATIERENWRVNSADLTQVLRLDPRAVVVPLEHDHLQLTLIDPARPLDDLIPVGLTNRPELAANQAMVQARLALVRQEKGRMVTPTILINGFQTPNEDIQAGIFGIGPNSSLNQWVGRADMSYQLLWQLEGMGIGNLARIKEMRGEQSRAIIELFKTQDRVAAEVTRSQARLQSAAARVGQADRALRTAIITFNGNYEGLQQTTRFGDVLMLVNRPQEAVFALQLMKVAYDNYFQTVAEYNRAQFEVFHALGYPAQELAFMKPPGQTVPVDTNRPAYLPPVADGPPPATR